jgi:DNA-binding PadR family transcriptional regulator
MKQPGTLELPVLGLLKERQMHGYELRKQLGAMLGPLWQVSWGSLYPTLRRLAKAGAVEKVAEARRPGGMSPGRRKTVYRITEKGEGLFGEMLAETGAVDAEHFTLKLAFFRYMDPESRLALLERRRAFLQEKLRQLKDNLRQYRERIDSYALSLQNHDLSATESDIQWIDELITKERGGQTQGVARPTTQTP